jgi:replicative DNA helicase
MIEKTENIILGTIISIPEFQEQIISSLTSDLFTKNTNKIVFGSIKNLYDKGSKIDLLTVSHNLSKIELEELGGVYYVASLTNNVASGNHWEDHVRILKEHYIRAQLIELFSKEINNLNDKSIDIEETYLNVTKNVDDLFNISSDELTPIYDVIRDRLNDYENATNKDLIGLNTGHSKINKITGGWQPGDLIILAGRPSMGKTAISLLFAKFPALQGKNVLYFSLEMHRNRIADRILSLECEIDSQKLLSGKLENYQWEQLDVKSNKFKDIDLKIEDNSTLTIENIKQICFKEHAKKEIDLVVIDYLGLIVPPTGKQSTNDKIGHISRSVKGLAKRLDCPIILLSQLNRAVESRPTKRPQMSDLRDSGNIEQDADIVLFVHRPEYYGFTEDGDGNSLKNVIELIIAKDRNGVIGTTYSYKNGNWSYIGEIPYEEYCSLNAVMPDIF